MWLVYPTAQLFLLILLTYTYASASTLAPDSARVRWSGALDSLRAMLSQVDADIARGVENEASLSEQLSQAEKRVNLQESLIREQKRRTNALGDSSAAHSAQLRALETRLDTLQITVNELSDARRIWAESMSHTLSGARRLRSWAALEFLFGSSGWRDLMERRSLLERLNTSQSQSLSAMGLALDSLQSTQEQAALEMAYLTSIRTELEANRSLAEEVKSEQFRTVHDLERNKRQLRKRLGDIKGGRAALEKRRGEISEAHQAIEQLVTRISKGQPIEGTPLIVFKGHLPWPVAGNLVESFGLRKNVELSTVTESPGIEITASPDAGVKAVADGEVSSVTWLRGFGNVCIIEHPGSYYTVYARLGEVSITQGALVSAGTNLGFPGFDSTAEEYRIHFEVWSGKDKHNPLEWLERK